MSQVQENHFQAFCALSQKVQKIQSQIKSEEIDSGTRVSFHRKLESIQDQIEKLTASAHSTSTSFREFEEMNRQVISLYKVVEDRFEEHEISLISKEAFALSGSLEKGKLLKVASQIESLKSNILFLFKHRQPSMRHREIVNLAIKLYSKADDVMSTMGKSLQDHLKFIQKLRVLLEEAMIRANLMVDPEEAELAMELYEIVDLFERRKLGEGNLRLNLIKNQLTPAQKRQLDKVRDRPDKITKILCEIASGNPMIEWEESDATESVIYTLHA